MGKDIEIIGQKLDDFGSNNGVRGRDSERVPEIRYAVLQCTGGVGCGIQLSRLVRESKNSSEFMNIII